MQNSSKRNSEQATRVARTAEICGVSERQVYRVINGDSKNEDVLRVYMEFAEGENALVEMVKKLVPFDNDKSPKVI
jgi:hypothetical protein